MKKTLIILSVIATVIAASCTKQSADENVSFAARQTYTPKAWERPVVELQRVGGSDSFYPVSISIDGKTLDWNKSMLVFYKFNSVEVYKLPRLSAGKHQITFSIGKATSDYVAAEEGSGSAIKASYETSVEINVEASPLMAIAFTLPGADIDAYVFIPETGYAYDNIQFKTKEQYLEEYKKSHSGDPECKNFEYSIISSSYTVVTSPAAGTKDFEISNVGERLKLNLIDTKEGKGFQVYADMTERKDLGKTYPNDPERQFTITVAGKSQVVTVQ